MKVADLIEQNIPELARLEALQAGKAISFATMEFQAPVESFRCTLLHLSSIKSLTACDLPPFRAHNFSVEAQLILDYAGYVDKMEGDSFMDPNDGFIKVPPQSCAPRLPFPTLSLSSLHLC